MTLLANRRSAILLFSLPNCLESHRTRIVIKEKEISAEIHEVDLSNIPEEVKILSPYDQYPSLVDRELVLQNSRVIIEYLDELKPEINRLIPEHKLDRARVRTVSYDLACDTQPIQNLRVLQYLEQHFSASQEDKAAWVINWIDKTFQTVEKRIQNTKSK